MYMASYSNVTLPENLGMHIFRQGELHLDDILSGVIVAGTYKLRNVCPTSPDAVEKTL